MIHLKIRTGFSFQSSFGTIDKIIESIPNTTAIGIADNSTWGHIPFYTACKKKKIKPILGVQLGVIDGDTLKKERQPLNYMTLIAKNNKGLKELYHAVNKAYLNKYYVPRLCVKDILKLSDNVFVLSGDMPSDKILKFHSKKSLLLEASPGSSPFWLNNLKKTAKTYKLKIIATADNYYPTVEDEGIYAAIAGRVTQNLTTIQHIPTQAEMELALPMIPKSAFSLSDKIADEIKIDLPKGKNITFKNVDLKKDCAKGWKERKIPNTKIYKDRLERELQIIKEKGYEGYFHLVADVVNYAKKKMLVGPARGSAAGSLVSYLMGITDVDPIKFELIFERFIDITRTDLPDIDIDFPDNKRESVIKYLRKTYGEDNVSHIGTVSRYMPKAALAEMAKLSGVPTNRLEDLKTSIIERQSGDERANKCLEDTFKTIAVGQKFIEDFPQMSLAAGIEGHPRHHGVHAAGILVCNKPVKDYCGVDPIKNIALIDKKGAEKLDLLKLDVLGLRTLTVLNTVLELKKLDRKFLLDLPLDNQATFDILKNEKWVGIFQFEGYTLQVLARQMGVDNFNDIVAITALARPGPLHSGGAAEFVSKKTGKAKVTYIHNSLKPITKETYGVLVFQEQIMKICREVGQMDWADVSTLRRIMGKTEGKEAFNQFWEKFKSGAMKRKVPEGDARRIWETMIDFGCLSGNAKIKLPTANQHSPREITIKQLFKNNGVAKVANKICNRNAQKNRTAKIWNVKNGVVKPENLVKVYESGKKETWLLTLTDGKKIRATKDHKFMVRDGWKPLKELNLGDHVAVMGSKFSAKKFKGVGSGAHNNWHGQSKLFYERQQHLKKTVKKCKICKASPNAEIHHKDGNRLNNKWNNLIPICRKCHRKAHRELDNMAPFPYQKGRQVAWSIVKNISNPKMEMTYDVAMPSPYNNFVSNDIVVHNSYAFNKSHAVSYGLLSYWCCYLKAHHPLEFALACLINEKDSDSTVWLLRELVNEGFEYLPVDRDHSEIKWSIKEGKLIGGLTNIKGVGLKKAQEIVGRRKNNLPLTKGLQKLLDGAKTPFDDIFECERRFGDYYQNPQEYNIQSGELIYIKHIHNPGNYLFIGKLKEKIIKDLNEFGDSKNPTNKSIYLNLTFEDDTDKIYAGIDRWKFPKFGKPIAEDENIDHWFIVKGVLRKGWRKIHIERIRSLGK